MGTSEDYERRHHRKQSTAVTSHDVALAAGVSQATVARTFSSPDLVASETKARVLEAAERLAYIPNAMARTLKSQRSRIVGVVVPSEGEYYQHVLTELGRVVQSTRSNRPVAVCGCRQCSRHGEAR